MTSTAKDGMRRYTDSSRNSVLSASQRLRLAPPLLLSSPCWPLAARGTSSRKSRARMPTNMEAPPMIMKATRQPWSPNTVRRARFVPTSVPIMVPTFMASCTPAKTFPRFDSDVTSAMMPLAMGRSEASITPFKDRRRIIGVRSSTPARTMVMRPCSTHPSTMMDLRVIMPRSAKVPHTGPAKFDERAWTMLMTARLFRLRPKSCWRAKKTHGSSTPSAPSNPPTKHSMDNVLSPGFCCWSLHASISTLSSKVLLVRTMLYRASVVGSV
mmetsp:Transcript_78735/g.197833  ORF Transcript_78735/g.197833 Transcript_78735/m.197833 type:complete len:269 (+) Transcript_78735:1121-1927(+)